MRKKIFIETTTKERLFISSSMFCYGHKFGLMSNQIELTSPLLASMKLYPTLKILSNNLNNNNNYTHECHALALWAKFKMEQISSLPPFLSYETNLTKHNILFLWIQQG